MTTAEFTLLLWVAPLALLLLAFAPLGRTPMQRFRSAFARFLNREPLLVRALVGVAAAVAVKLRWDLSGDDLYEAFAVIAGSGALSARARVYSPATVAEGFAPHSDAHDYADPDDFPEPDPA